MNIWQTIGNVFFYEKPLEKSIEAPNFSKSLANVAPIFPPDALVRGLASEHLELPPGRELMSRIDKKVSGEQFTKITTSAGPYEVLSKIKPEEHPIITGLLAASGRHHLEPKNKAHAICLGQGSYGSVRFAASDAHPLCVVKKTNEKAGNFEIAAADLLKRIPERERGLFVQTFDAVQAVGKKGKLNTYIFQEYMSQGDLSSPAQRSRLKHGVVGSWEPQEKMDLAKALCAPVAALHRAGLFHRDIKPENFLLHEGKVKLADFGFLTDQRYPEHTCGTRKFMPPEYASGAMRADQSDTFALGVVLYNLAGGYHPTVEFGVEDNIELDQEQEFRFTCDQAMKTNETKPSLQAVALQLMHPDFTKRLTATQAERLLATVSAVKLNTQSV